MSPVRPAAARWAGSAILLALIAVLAGAAALAQETGRISGQVWVTGAEGRQPVANATLVLSLEGNRRAETTTNARGEFAFEGLEAGDYQVIVVGWPARYGPTPSRRRAPTASVSVIAGGDHPTNFELTFRGGRGTSPTGEGRRNPIGPILDRGHDLWDNHRPWVLGAAALAAAALLLGALTGRPPRGPRRSKPVDWQGLQEARAQGLEGLNAFRDSLGPIRKADPRLVSQLYLAYRDERGWSQMYGLIRKMPKWLRRLQMVRQQHAFALNRDGRGGQAERKLQQLLRQNRRSAETLGLLGRVYKDRWEQARDAGKTGKAAKLLDQAVETYIAGYDADPTNPYPGLNALTLMEFYDEPPAGRESLLLDLSARVEDLYWSHAARLEAAIHAGEEERARAAVAATLETPHVVWQLETTVRNLELYRTARVQNGREVQPWVEEIIGELTAAMSPV